MHATLRKVDLALFLPSLIGGGAERVMVSLANTFAARGHSIDLVLASATGPYIDDVVPAVRIVDLKSSRVLTSIPKLARYIRETQPSSILSGIYHANLAAILARQISGRRERLIISEHNSLEPLSKSRTGAIALYLMRRLYPRADGISAVSSGVAEDLQSYLGLPKESVRVVYNPVVTSQLSARAKEPLHHEWTQPGAPPIILGVGRLSRQKNFEMLVRSFAAIADTMDARLVILGEGELRPALEDQIRTLGLEDRVLMPGFVANPYQWMAHARVFALSSRWEGLPGVLIEAMACGASVVATDCRNGPREILEDGKYGRLVPVDDDDAMAKALALSLKAPTPPETHARALTFNPDASADAYAELLSIERNDVCIRSS